MKKKTAVSAVTAFKQIKALSVAALQRYEDLPIIKALSTSDLQALSLLVCSEFATEIGDEAIANRDLAFGVIVIPTEGTNLEFLSNLLDNIDDEGESRDEADDMIDEAVFGQVVN